MKIAIVTNRFPTISETFVSNLAIGLVSNGLDVDIISASKAQSLDTSGIRLVKAPIYTSNITKLLYCIINFRTVIKRLKKNTFNIKKSIIETLLLIPFTDSKYDIVHFQFSSIATKYNDVLDDIDIKKIMSCRGTAEKILASIDKTRKEMLIDTSKKIDLVHCVSSDMKNVVLEYGIEINKIFVNRPAVDPDKFYRGNDKIKNQTVKIISVGRIEDVKNYLFIVDCIKDVVKQVPNLEYRIIGSGSQDKKIKTYVNEHRLNKYVIFEGSIDNHKVPEFLRLSDILVLGSKSEGINNSVLEAMSSSIAVLCSDVGGMSEVINNNVDGILFDLNDKKMFIDRLLYLINNDDIRIKLGIKAREKIVKNFNITNQTNIFIEKYKSIINEP